MRHCVALTLSLALALPSLPASAAGPGAAASSNVDAARVHFQRGTEFYREGNYDAALAEFAEAQRLAPNYRLLYNIGQVQAERHDYVAAVRTLMDYLAQGGADLPEERRSQVQAELASLKTKISELTVTSNVAGAEVSVDGVQMGLLPLSAPLLVSAGSRRITLTKRGYNPVERTIVLTGEDKATIDVPLLAPVVTAPIKATPRGATPPPHESSSNVGLWVSVIAAGGFAAGATTFGLMARSKNAELDEQLDKQPLDAARVADLRSGLKLDAALCDGLASASAVSAILAVYFIVSGSRDSEPRDSKRAGLVAQPHGLALRAQF
jgi:tetratricopeptide (TPR) repeat protein